MRSDLWYAEELITLRVLVATAIRDADPSHVAKMTALGHLHTKLTNAIALAPSAKGA